MLLYMSVLRSEQFAFREKFTPSPVERVGFRFCARPVKCYEHLTGLVRRTVVYGPCAVFWLVVKPNGLPTFGYGWQAVFVLCWVPLTAECGA